MKLPRALFSKITPRHPVNQGEDAYELLSNALPFGVSILDRDLNICRSNEQMKVWFPALRAEHPGKCYEVFNDPPRSSPCPECRRHRDFEGKSATSFVRNIRTPTGFRILRLKTFPLKSGQDMLDGFLEIAEDITEEKKQSALQKDYLSFLELIAKISADIVTVSDEEWDGEIQNVLRQLGEFFKEDRCCLFRFDPEKNLLTNTHEWCAPGISSQIEYLQDVPESVLPWWFGQMKARQIIHYPDIRELPPEAALEHEELVRQNIQSIIYFPMSDDSGQCIGCIGFDSVQTGNIWPESQISIFSVFTTLLTGALLRKKDREELLYREQQYRLLVDNSMNGLLSLELFCDVGGKPLDVSILSANPEACKILGRSLSMLIEKKASDVFPDLISPLALKEFSLVVRNRAPRKFELFSQHVQKHLVCMSYFLNGLRFALVLVDETERIKATEGLLKKTGELENYFNASLEMLCILRKDGQFIEANPEWQNSLGYNPESLYSQNIFELIPAGDHPVFRKFLISATDSKDSPDLVLQLKHADGSLRWIEMRTRGVGNLIYAASRDITKKKSAEDEQKRLQQQLNQALKMESIGRLAGGVAHDFNNTLQIILGNAEMALNFHAPSPELKEIFMEVRDAAKRSATLTRQLLTFARKQNTEPEIVNVNTLLTSMIRMLQRLIGEQIKLDWDLEEPLWPVKIDPGQVDQILINLCVNAGDAIQADGSVHIETRNTAFSEEEASKIPHATAGQYVQLSVSDSGEGISPEMIETIFEPFVTTKAEGKGSGLGLATVHGIILQNSGFITVKSAPGQGSCFSVFLPRHDEKVHEAPQNPEPKPLRGGLEHILIVEDEPLILQMTELTLKKLGYKTSTAPSPKEALELAKNPSVQIDLLLTDVVMPEMDGKELSRQISLLRKEMKTLFMSGYTNETITKYGIEAPEFPFIQKPFSMEDISRKIREVLNTSKP